MAGSERASILSRIRRLSAEAGGASDAHLLDRFLADRDEAAFELLVWRYARLVFGVCLRVLHDPHDAEDAFQATFLLLARKAGSIARRQAVAGWLHKVARRTALTALRRRARRSGREKLSGTVESLSASADTQAAAENEEIRQILDEEIGRLPERFRAAVVLCYLEGKSVDEAARLLGCPRGTVASRLVRARQRLQVRLCRRGLAVTAALAALQRANAAGRPLARIPALTAAGLRYAQGGSAGGAVPPRITALTEEVLHAMFLHKLKTGVAVVVTLLGILLAGGGLAIGLHAGAGQEVSRAQEAGGDAQAADRAVARAPHPVTVCRPVRRQAAPYKDYTGQLEASRAVEVRPALSGFVQKVCFHAGAEVKKGDVLFELDSRGPQLALEKAEAELAQAQANKRHRDADLARTRKLLDQKVVGPGEVDALTERVAVAAAAVKAAEAEVARARLELEGTRVAAPMSGRVGRPLVETGTLVFRGQDRATLLTTVTSLDPIRLTFDMDERSFLGYQRLLRDKQVKGAGGTLRMGLADEDGFPHEGTLTGFDDRVRPDTGTVKVHGSFPNPGLALLPGMFARVRMTVGPPRALLAVPEEAVLTDQGHPYVFVVGKDNIAERRTVTLGQTDRGMRLIEKGLAAEDWVVIAGLGSLRPGTSVEPRKLAAPDRPDPNRGRDH